MGLKEIKAAGDMAAKLVNATHNMNTIFNQHRGDFESLVADVQEAYGVGLADMSDTEVGDFFGFYIVEEQADGESKKIYDKEAIADAHIILREWSNNIQTLASSVARLPGNNI